MYRVLTAIGVAGVLIMGAQAIADPRSQPPTARRQLLDCMSRRMSADKTLSYNEAAKRCKEQAKNKGATMISSDPAKSARAH
jgi:hypothetical protein